MVCTDNPVIFQCVVWVWIL